ncbi:hypothetical protein E2C01_051748 [Portunus trituberculatus]|uniref:Uncharacterized protein n=1 Tax=Portunus trituberculatus TaxID=210409 RepID=A0A5B7GCL9_PORTR|nr:hypothetical protein [Portunus trituberculatus]
MNKVGGIRGQGRKLRKERDVFLAKGNLVFLPLASVVLVRFSGEKSGLEQQKRLNKKAHLDARSRAGPREIDKRMG